MKNRYLLILFFLGAMAFMSCDRDECHTCHECECICFSIGVYK
jgi:hypothetical protein